MIQELQKRVGEQPDKVSGQRGALAARQGLTAPSRVCGWTEEIMALWAWEGGRQRGMASGQSFPVSSRSATSWVA